MGAYVAKVEYNREEFRLRGSTKKALLGAVAQEGFGYFVNTLIVSAWFGCLLTIMLLNVGAQGWLGRSLALVSFVLMTPCPKSIAFNAVLAAKWRREGLKLVDEIFNHKGPGIEREPS